jgi:hypothetical protein
MLSETNNGPIRLADLNSHPLRLNSRSRIDRRIKQIVVERDAPAIIEVQDLGRAPRFKQATIPVPHLKEIPRNSLRELLRYQWALEVQQEDGCIVIFYGGTLGTHRGAE